MFSHHSSPDLKNSKLYFLLAGRRGAFSAEYFLRNDYAVIFLYRRGSQFPFASNFQRYLKLYILF